ncbi:MAG: von Willebrand factor, type, partial [Bryobacterales bacterium]|nr:von Willebrand factor, type [Bryobacterales bacterium]
DFLLKQIAQSTGGRFYPNLSAADAAQIFDSGGRFVPGSLQLWPGLLGLAILLNLIELVLRKWRGLLEALRGGALAPQP